jgi:hypothetical protein
MQTHINTNEHTHTHKHKHTPADMMSRGGEAEGASSDEDEGYAGVLSIDLAR